MYPWVVLASKGSNDPGSLSGPRITCPLITKVKPRRPKKRTLENSEVHCGTLSGAPGPPGGHRDKFRSAVAEPKI
eukprot:585397-Hanusia_phi.AAC.1